MKNYTYHDQLTSERLITRYLTLEDIPIWKDFFEDEEAVEFLYLDSLGLNSNLEISAHMIEKQLARYVENRFGLQALIDKSTNEFIGLCGLLAQEVDGQQEIEVGYHILKKHWKQGYATEAAKLFMKYAFENNLTNSIVSVIDVDNFKSQRVAEKNGLKIEKQIKWIDDEDVYVYRMNIDKCN
jgi:RimJ/RimL family protein N-acetyltransferase